jgi:hypothetical protein
MNRRFNPTALIEAERTLGRKGFLNSMSGYRPEHTAAKRVVLQSGNPAARFQCQHNWLLNFGIVNCHFISPFLRFRRQGEQKSSFQVLACGTPSCEKAFVLWYNKKVLWYIIIYQIFSFPNTRHTLTNLLLFSVLYLSCKLLISSYSLFATQYCEIVAS